MVRTLFGKTRHGDANNRKETGRKTSQTRKENMIIRFAGWCIRKSQPNSQKPLVLLFISTPIPTPNAAITPTSSQGYQPL